MFIEVAKGEFINDAHIVRLIFTNARERKRTHEEEAEAWRRDPSRKLEPIIDPHSLQLFMVSGCPPITIDGERASAIYAHLTNSSLYTL
jgi:hypothetical protein